MASDDQGHSHLTPLLSNQLHPSTPPPSSYTKSNTVQNTDKPTKVVVSRRRRNGSRTPRAIFDVENGECVGMPQRVQITSSDLQQPKEPLSDGKQSCFGQDRKRAAVRRIVDNEVEKMKKSKKGLILTSQEKSKIGMVKNDAVKNNDPGNKKVLKQAISSQAVLTLGPSSPSPMIPPKLSRYHASKLSTSVKNTNAPPLDPILPTVYSSKHPDLNVITPETVAEVLRGDYEEQLVQYKLLDCRFPYEFQGGSLTGASSSCDPEKMEMQLFVSTTIEGRNRTALIFFCEFSANRAPKMLRHVRNVDRRLHADCYPELYYPELYLIDGGYRNCFETLQHELCAPLAMYVAMEDERFTDTCRHEFATWRRRWKPHKIVANCAAKLNMPSHVDRHSCHQVRRTASGVRSLFDKL